LIKLKALNNPTKLSAPEQKGREKNQSQRKKEKRRRFKKNQPTRNKAMTRHTEKAKRA